MRTSSQNIGQLVKEIINTINNVKNWQAYNITNLASIRSFVGSHDGWLFTIVETDVEDNDAPRYSGMCRNSQKKIFMHLPIDVAESAAKKAMRVAGSN